MDTIEQDILDVAEASSSPQRNRLSPLRKAIAARMTEAKQSIPHFRVVADIEMDELLRLRREINARSVESKVSVNDFIVKACALALNEWPAINSHFCDNEIVQFPESNISIVVSIDGGLTIPVLRKAETKTVQEIARELASLVSRAASGQLKMSDISGGSFTISNMGMYGVDQFDAIINPPQIAILAAARAKKKVIVVDNEAVIRTVMRVTLSVDHRAVDGAIGAGFLTSLSAYLENPKSLLSEL
ncbi:2-oxo acid dehydrogenase subunit E2 [SAR92 clade bacterium H455]|uniref:2-oxo acid dehydrogenase subunit E2 n=1 Tax=SAR92 clade bacterium H455 TaxID=2974818 RepID=A0ABY5TP39_9GAMM|nr:2-oxo acid dehydrogenase subunit E2 [SAR92 clade bacterium H455]